MPIFGGPSDETLQTINQLKQQLQEALTEVSGLKIQLVQAHATVTAQTRQAEADKADIEASRKALRVFEEQLKKSFESDGMLRIGGEMRWIDPAAVWHLNIERPGAYINAHGQEKHSDQHTLYLNSQYVMQGPEAALLAIANQIVKARQTPSE
jgi:DNA repair exonuclease SbcCD ATPase subunit